MHLIAGLRFRLLALMILVVGCVASPPLFGETTKLVEAGMPASSREWSGADYAQASKVLIESKMSMPRLSDREGSAFVERLTSAGNLGLLADKAAPLMQRLQNYEEMMTGISTITKLYLNAANEGEPLHREVTLELTFMLRCAAQGMNLLDELVPTITRDDLYETRMKGVEMARHGMTTIFAGAETSLGETTFYSKDDLSLLLSAMAETLPTAKRAFAADYRVELRKKLEADRTAFPQTEDAANLQRMIAEISK